MDQQRQRQKLHSSLVTKVLVVVFLAITASILSTTTTYIGSSITVTGIRHYTIDYDRITTLQQQQQQSATFCVGIVDAFTITANHHLNPRHPITGKRRQQQLNHYRQQRRSSSSSSSLLLASTTPITSTATHSFMIDLSDADTAAIKRQQQEATLFYGCTTQQYDTYDVVTVDLDQDRDYPIYIGTNYTNQQASDILRQHIHGKKVLIITNDRIAPMYLQKYKDIVQQQDTDIIVETFVVPDGEENKSFDILQSILTYCLQCQLDRQSTLIALGGGVIGDMVGFAASIYQRGIDFIQIPTTVMAMVDSSVGGKTGINHELGKNMIGAFHQPQCVLIDIQTLQTLPQRELCSGIAEIIKYGLIRDTEFFLWQEEYMDELLARNATALRYAITRSCQNKAAVVKADEQERSNVHATLNLGHTFGHAIENGCGYGTWLHGEAVSIGTAMAATMSHKMQWISDELKDRIYTLLQRAQLPIALPTHSPMNRDVFLQLMSVDKKVANGKLRLILLQGALGNCVFTGDFDQNAMIETIDEFVVNCTTDSQPAE